MKFTSVLLVVSCMLSAVKAQWLETTISLPDSCGPSGLCYNLQNNKVYCANYSSDTVAVIDGGTNQVIAAARVGLGPCALCYNPVSNKVYSASECDNTVAVIDGETDTVVATVLAGISPGAFCHNSQDNKVYCANRHNNEVTVIDGVGDTVVARAYMVGWPTALCYESQKGKVYCANWGANTVTVIDGATNQELCTIGVGDGPVDICHNPQQNRVYVANHGSSSISVLRDSGGGIEESLKPQAASPKPTATVVRGVLFLVANGEGRIARRGLLDISGRKVLDLHAGPNSTKGLAPGVYFVPSDWRGKTQRVVLVE